MTETAKVDLRHRRVAKVEDVTDLVEMLFPGNRNQQHTAARILLALRDSTAPVRTLSDLERRHRISRRTLQRTRAKLARLGLIEHVTWMNSRYGGQDGWRLSSRMSTGLRQLADWLDEWRYDDRSERCRKETLLAELLRP